MFFRRRFIIGRYFRRKTKSKTSDQPYKVFTPFMRYLRASYRVEKINNTKVKYAKFNPQIKEELKTEEMKKILQKIMN